MWKLSDGKRLREINIELSASMASITCIRINPQNSKVYASCLDRSIKVFGLKSGQMLKQFQGCNQNFVQVFEFVKIKHQGG